MFGFFKTIKEWVQSFKLPDWIRDILSKLYVNVLLPIIQQLGKDALSLIQTLIVEASNKDISGEDKFKWVVKEFRERYSDDSIKDRALNLAVEVLFNYLKNINMIT